ncbi:MAG: TonB-dependent receptor [bacterium]|nr:TonB-dependent receptor [bacterium]
MDSKRWSIFQAVTALTLFVPVLIYGARRVEAQQFDLSDLSIEELMSIEVSSVSKKLEPMSDAAAAVYVITSEDIRRTGYTTIPDVLRLVPGVEVAQVDLNTWAISARGFNSQMSSKLLVMVDGRSVYSPLFSGVFWDAQDMMLEDIERIEVIRGPGATMWGANAVNGVINIITKSAESTQGGLACSQVASSENFGLVARYGGQLGSNSQYRFYVKGFDRHMEAGNTGPDLPDYWSSTRGGFRVDSRISRKVDATFTGGLFTNRGQYSLNYITLTPPYSGLSDSELRSDGGDFTAKLNYAVSSKSTLSLMSYADYLEHNHPGIAEKRFTVDVGMQHIWSPNSRHEVVAGMEYRNSSDVLTDGLGVSTPVPSMVSWLYSAFAQDEIAILPAKLSLTLGSKFERNFSTDWEVQPNARVMYVPARGHKVWCSAAKAVRTPSRMEYSGVFRLAAIPPMSVYNPTPLPIQVLGVSQGQIVSEKLTATEVGYRVQPHRELALDISGYYNDYKDIRGFETGQTVVDMTGPIPNVTQYVNFKNTNYSHGYGGEVSIDWKPIDIWRLRGGFSVLRLETRAAVDNILLSGVLPPNADTVDPENQAWLQNSVSLPHNVDVDFIVRYVDHLRDRGVASYIAGDARVGWTVSQGLEIFTAAQNMFGGKHTEFQSDIMLMALSRDIEPQFLLGATWSFGHLTR